MRRSDSVFVVLLCLAIIYYVAAGEENKTVFSSGKGKDISAEAEMGREESRKPIVPKTDGKRYSAEFEQKGTRYTITAADTRETCRERGEEYGIFEIAVQDGEENIIQEFICQIPVRHVVSFSFDDLDFDGLSDLQVGYSNWKNDTNYCMVYLWDEEAGKFSGGSICIPQEYTLDEERKVFQTVFRDDSGEERVICRINENRELEKFRYWKIDYAAYQQVIADPEGDRVIYEGMWSRYAERMPESIENYEDIFWSGLGEQEGKLRIYLRYRMKDCEVLLQDLIPDKSLKLVFCKDGEEKIIKVLQEYADYYNPREYILEGWEDSSGGEGVYLWNHRYPRWGNTECYTVKEGEMVRLDDSGGENRKDETGEDETGKKEAKKEETRKAETGKEETGKEENKEEKDKGTADADTRIMLEKRLGFAEKLLQSEQKITMEQAEYLAATEEGPEREIDIELYSEVQRLIDRAYTTWDITVRGAARGDLDGDGTDDIAAIGMEENGDCRLYVCLNRKEGAVLLDNPVKLDMMDSEGLYRPQIGIVKNAIIITGWGGEVFWFTQTLAVEYEDYEIEKKFIMNGEGEQGVPGVRWEIYDYGRMERKFFFAADTEKKTVELLPLEMYLDMAERTEEPLEDREPLDERKVYEEFLSGGGALYVRKEALGNGTCLNTRRFSVWEKYTLEDILSFMQMDYWLDGEGADGKIKEIQYAYLDCGGDGFLDLAVRFIGMGIDGVWDDDDSNITLIISCKNGKLELCYAFEEWARSMTDINYYGFMESGGSNGAVSHGYANRFLDENCMEKTIYVIDENWGGGCASYSYEDYERIFAVGTEIEEPSMYIQCYHIDDKTYQCYHIEETEAEKIGRCEEYIDALRQGGEAFYTMAEIDGKIAEQKERFGIREEWAEQTEPEWKKMDSRQYSAYVKE